MTTFTDADWKRYQAVAREFGQWLDSVQPKTDWAAIAARRSMTVDELLAAHRVCDWFDGRGVYPTPDGPDDFEWVHCEDCNGTGNKALQLIKGGNNDCNQ